MVSDIKNSRIWMESLDRSSKFSELFPDQVEKLRNSFFNTRENVEKIAITVRDNMPMLTIHDISHIDALWETASLILSPETKLNPLEAYIFGCCTLFHDLGMALSVYDEDINKIKLSKEYIDIKYDISTANDKTNITENDIENKALEIRIRQLHAFKSRELPKKHWTLKDETFYLLEDQTLRKGLSSKIGIMSESHWWDIEKIRQEFYNNKIGPALPEFPVDWKINNYLIACLIRLADFIHIDYRRAPNFFYIITKPTGISKNHWNFQNKLNRPTIENDSLVFESIEDFNIDEIDSWWTCFEMVTEIDQEIRKVDGLLDEFNEIRFKCRKVKGIENPISFSRYIKTSGWLPTNTQYKATNIQSLIERFGGDKLYGKEYFVPIRELIQNAIDAVNSKKYYDPKLDGSIFISFTIDENQDEWLTITDNGIGMSENVLINSLLDFGNSFWKSNIVASEHPGLKSSQFKPIGKYGIGFYSIFMIADQIEIISKPLKGNKSANILEFRKGINQPPILKQSTNDIFNSGTTIKIKSKFPNLLEEIINSFPIEKIQIIIDEEIDTEDVPYPYIETLDSFRKKHNKLNIKKFKKKYSFKIEDPLAFICRMIAPAINVSIYSKYKQNEQKLIVSANDWCKISPLELLRRLLGVDLEHKLPLEVNNQLELLSNNLSVVKDQEKNAIGISTIVIDDSSENNNKFNELWSSNLHFFLRPVINGIITTFGMWEESSPTLPGLWFKENNLLSRNNIKLEITRLDLSTWTSDQYTRIYRNFNKTISDYKKIKFAGRLYSLGSFNEDLPLVHSSKGILSYSEFVNSIKNKNYVILTGNNDYIISNHEVVNEDYFVIPNYSYENIYNGFKEIKNNSIINFAEFKSESNAFTFLQATISAIFKSWGFNYQDKKEILELTSACILEDKFRMFVSHNIKSKSIKTHKQVFVIINPKKTTKEVVKSKFVLDNSIWGGVWILRKSK